MNHHQAASRATRTGIRSRDIRGIVLAILIVVPSAGPAAPERHAWWPPSVERILARPTTARAEIQRALDEAPPDQREGLQFLIENMPERDLRSLSAAYLLENVAQAYAAREAAPWRDRLPRDIFFNDVLPYASVNESRDDWRRLLREKCGPLIADCRTPAEAAQRLNQKLFKLVNVRYSTERHRADQGPLETLNSGKATCTGLSILLVDACRSVGIPARLVATPLWVNLRGNHTWVEVWDGDWHFTGAAEPDPNGLDRGWFTHDAAQARKEEPRHAIYASSFRQTGLSFPLAWASAITDVPAVNVTDRYAPAAPSLPSGSNRLLVSVLDHQAGGRRVAAQVVVTDQADPATRHEGTSRAESADRNDMLPFSVRPGRTYEILATRGKQRARREYRAGTNAEEVVMLALDEPDAETSPARYCVASPGPPGASASAREPFFRGALAYFSAPAGEQARWKFPSRMDRFVRDHENAAREAAWRAFQSAPVHAGLRQDFERHQVRFGGYLSAYTVRAVGERAPGGWPLFIAMHGGGNAPKEVNDSQWKIMQRYYKDHPEAGGYLYLALRAPNDTWNGFYDVYVYPLVANLIRQFLLWGDVDPDKVFLMGYSHGGYGAFAIGPKMPDRFAAIHASAAAPTDGETTARTLRNTVFTCMVGEKDTQYGRYERDKRFKESVDALRAGRTDIYPVSVRIVEGRGHTGLPDRDKIAAMYPNTRQPAPRDLSWLMTDDVIRDFYWLQAAAPGKKQEIEATCHDNHVTVTASTNVQALTLLLDSRLVSFDRPVVVEVNGQAATRRLQPNTRTLLDTLQRRGDPELAFTVALSLPLARAHP